MPTTDPGGSALRRLLVAVALALFVAAMVFVGRFTMRWVSGPTCQVTASGTTHAFTPSQTRNASIITAVALKRGLPARAATIALATAIQESGLENLDHGDRDSLGLFQQRPSQGWGTPEQVRDPHYAAGAFYDALVKVEDYENRPITEVAQEVQRSAYPTAYADHEQEGRVLASTLAGHSPAGLACRLDTAATGDPAGVSDALFADLGQRGVVEARTVTVHTSSARHAWMVAEWAAAQADHHGVTVIEVAGRRWQRAEDPLSWSPGEADAEGTTVTITLA